MLYKIRVNGGNVHYQVDMVIVTDSPDRVEKIRSFSNSNKFQFYLEVISP